ncbi:D-isomer specific 2-hydroxyacid dehydrogenase, NAD-binding protein [Lunatimonas lonarensis]|uniref:Glyoxylate/hydroxypyruvate reductase B n=1 Tax=Lunatimonas lonarensis TaxID=1232681 RepID=R7ZN14_9BACT|nr:D-glycerate dehydrogenase [Lunatimonas lonarensis]EON75414.1 D-isomer specific 2-hydroxyacid dehydrogenase, NAD-binding protein [Lunatimonas lonarensis]
MKVFINKVIPAYGLRLLKEAGVEVTMWEDSAILSREEAIAFCKQHDAFLSAGQAGLDEGFFRQCSHLKVVALHSVGFDGVDIAAATQQGIPIGNTPNVLNKATAETALLLMLTVARRALFLHRKIKRGEWGVSQPTQDLGFDLAGKTLGIVGLGRIGSELARMCRQSWGMKIVYHNRSRNYEAEDEFGATWMPFEELLASSDCISVHTALTQETRGLFGYEQFKQMKPGAIFVNTARGGVHCEPDLIRALREGVIYGAGLDVTDPEPMAPDNPLLDMDNAVVFPHIGSSTVETRNEMSRCAAENILAGLRGERLPYPVNPEVYG